MRHFKAVSLATLTPVALASTALLMTVLAVRETSGSFPIPPQADSTVSSSAPQTHGEQLYAYCPPVNCSGGGSR